MHINSVTQNIFPMKESRTVYCHFYKYMCGTYISDLQEVMTLLLHTDNVTHFPVNTDSANAY